MPWCCAAHTAFSGCIQPKMCWVGNRPWLGRSKAWDLKRFWRAPIHKRARCTRQRFGRTLSPHATSTKVVANPKPALGTRFCNGKQVTGRLNKRPACQLSRGTPYADVASQRVYIRRLNSEAEQITLTHEYFAFALCRPTQWPQRTLYRSAGTAFAKRTMT